MNKEKTYYENITELAELAVEQYLEGNFDELTDSILDLADNACIYYVDHAFIMNNTANEDAVLEINGEAPQGDSFQEIQQAFAYWAVYQDITDRVYDNFDTDRLETIREYLDERRNRKAA